MIGERQILDRKYDRRHVVQRFERRHADAEVAVLTLWVNFIPMLAEQPVDKTDATDEAGQIPIENEKLGEDRQQPDVARAAEERTDGGEFGVEVDRRAIEWLSLRTGKEG